MINLINELFPAAVCEFNPSENQNFHLNPLRPNSDQHQFSPCNINAYSTPEVIRIKDMITQGKFS